MLGLGLGLGLGLANPHPNPKQGMKEAKTIEHKAERGKADWRLADTNF